MDRIRNAELADKVVFFIERYINHRKCRTMVEDVFFKKCPNYLKVFETQVGMPLDEYIMKVRLHRAERLLVQTKMDYKEIANAIGMNGYFEFTQSFKLLYGITPSSYRNQLVREGK